MRLLSLALLLAACSSRPPKREPEPVKETPRTGDERIVALIDGKPVTWREVAERSMDLELKRNIDLYVRWKVLENLRAKFAIVNTPEDLRKRADAMIGEYKRRQGEDVFKKQLAVEGFTEEKYREFVVKNRLFAEKLTLEKMVRFGYLSEGWVETDRMLFAEQEDAKSFLARAREQGFDKAADGTKEARGRVTRRPREVFLRDLAPGDLQPATVEKIFTAAEGAMTELELSRTGVFCVILVRKRFSALRESYDSLKERVFNWILEEPLADAELGAWIDLQVKRSKVEYADRGTQGN